MHPIKDIQCPRRSNPISRSDRFQSNPRRISSETDIFHKNSVGSEMVFVGFISVGIRPGFYRNSTARDEIRPDLTLISSDSVKYRRNSSRIPTDRNTTKTVSDPTELIQIRPHPTPHESPGWFQKLLAHIYRRFFLIMLNFETDLSSDSDSRRNSLSDAFCIRILPMKNGKKTSKKPKPSFFTCSKPLLTQFFDSTIEKSAKF
jgi:hypothetical protein